MASSSSNDSQRKYDVFLNFRGKDTRCSLVAHLEKALEKKKIEVFIDDKLEEGNGISHALLKAIEESYISLIIFSKSYAESEWCLEELVKIIKCKENHDHYTIPIFYDVDPSIARHQIGSYREAFAKHENRKHDADKLESWKTALTKAANLSGFVSSDFKNDAELVEDIVYRVLRILNKIRPPYVPTGLIGIHEQIQQLESFLCNRKQNVHIIGIWGMGGIGKTTMASLLFKKLCHEYEGCHFLENVREKSGNCGISQLKNELISNLLGKENSGTAMPALLSDHVYWKLRLKKVLVVLDDVDDSSQIEDLTGGYDWFGPGSTIIITSRDKSVFSQYCSDQMYEVKALDPEQSLHLFSLHAFETGCLKMEGSDDLSKRFVGYAKGNPLALKVLGSSLHGKSEEHWRSQLAKLVKIPLKKIQNVSELSYAALDPAEKEIFLYIACVFKGNYEEIILSLLDSGLFPEVGLKALEDKALITKSPFGYISMHNLIQEMGRHIVCEEWPKNLGKRRHLWDHDDIYKVLKNKWGTELIESINLQCERINEIQLDAEAFKGMMNLKFLKFKCKNGLLISHKSLDSLPEELKYFYWEWYPLKLPPKLCFKNLVQFHMPGSKLERLWDGIQDLGNLKEIDLSHSEDLKELPDMSMASKLYIVDLSFCCNLSQLHPSILSSSSLGYLYLEGCSSLLEFSLSSMQLRLLSLSMSYIDKFYLPITHGLSYSVTYLEIIGTNVVSSPKSIKHLSNLQKLLLSSCLRLRCISELSSSIKCLDVSDCISLEVFTPNFSRPSHIQQHLNPHYSFTISLMDCEKLDEDTVRAIAMDFVFITMGAVYQQPPLSRHSQQPAPSTYRIHNSLCRAYLLGSKISDVLDFMKRPCPISETTKRSPRSDDLMVFIFCVVFRKQSADQAMFCSCNLEISNGQRIQYRRTLPIPYADGDHALLWYDEDFNRNIINGIKENRASSSATEKNPKVSFDFSFRSYDEILSEKENLGTVRDKEKVHGIKKIGVFPVLTSELHYLFDNNAE